MIISFDDGHKDELKGVRLLDKYKLKAIFFIPTWCELNEFEIKEIAKKHEIGGHTISHPQDMKRLSDEQQEFEIADNRKWLQDITKQKINWFCYPGGKYNQTTIKYVKKAGYKYARTTDVGKFEKPSLTTPTSVHIHPKSSWLTFATKNWKRENFHIWGHSWEIDKYNLWNKLEQFYESVSNTIQ